MASTEFKIYSLLVVKNEADILPTSLKDACRWSDKIIVMDNGSTDESWEIVNRMSHDYPQIIPFCRYEGVFHIGLRARLYKAFRHEMHRGDWWCVRLDADELYQGDVRQFLSRVPKRYRTVKKESINYLLSREDLPLLTGDFEHDRPLIHHTAAQKGHERRFMRHCPLWIWHARWRYPHPWGRVWKEFIPVAHYQYRSEAQMRQRWATRHEAKKNGCGTFKHENLNGWEEYLWKE